MTHAVAAAAVAAAADAAATEAAAPRRCHQAGMVAGAAPHGSHAETASTVAVASEDSRLQHMKIMHMFKAEGLQVDDLAVERMAPSAPNLEMHSLSSLQV